MLQNHPQQILPSPARLGLTNPNSPSLPNPSTPKLSTAASSSSQPQQPTSAAAATTTRISPTLLPLLPPLPRAQALLLQMAALASKLFDVSPNRSLWLASFRGSLPTFLPYQSLPSASLSSTKDVLSLFTSLQTQLFEAVSQLQEILDLQDSKLKLSHDIRSLDSSLLSFSLKLKDAVAVLDLLSDDYAPYRHRLCTPSAHLPLSDILSYAHRISYTTFAPPEFAAGHAPLRGALPPAPQEEQMRASQLYAFADLDVGLPKPAPPDHDDKAVTALNDAAAPPHETPLGMLAPPPISVPSGWRPGMPVELPTDLPADLPLLPPGWKPGDPLPLPPVAPKKDEDQRPTVQMPAAPMPPKAPEPIQVRFVQLDINPDQDEYSSDYSSEVGSSEEDDED